MLPRSKISLISRNFKIIVGQIWGLYPNVKSWTRPVLTEYFTQLRIINWWLVYRRFRVFFGRWRGMVYSFTTFSFYCIDHVSFHINVIIKTSETGLTNTSQSWTCMLVSFIACSLFTQLATRTGGGTGNVSWFPPLSQASVNNFT